MHPAGAQDLEAFYRRYLQRCNEHQFKQLGEFVAEDVVVNDAVHGLPAYVEGLQHVVRDFPDYHWDLRHLIVEGCLLSAHLLDTGTLPGTFLDAAATGRVVTTQEFAVYRIEGAKIVESWGSPLPCAC